MASVLRATISIKKCISANCKKVSLTPNFPRCKITTNSPIFQYLLLGIFHLKSHYKRLQVYESTGQRVASFHHDEKKHTDLIH